MINQDTVENIKDFIDFVSDDWLSWHTTVVSFDDICHTITISIDNVNEEDYKLIKDSL